MLNAEHNSLPMNLGKSCICCKKEDSDSFKLGQQV